MNCCLVVGVYAVCDREKSVLLVMIRAEGRETERAAWLQASEVISLAWMYVYQDTQLIV